ncbi:hypothetical protein [Pseudophaeobacter sp.]|uniref:hypothetical protein n=1 Tax=Pseudophaeobacter sp. TaxID=1971739 RepID=UPI003299A9DA
MKLIKLIAAAAVLGIAAIALTFLQFSGSGEAANSQNLSAIQRFNPVISAAGASPLTDAASVPEAASGTQDSSALVAQITAGTLAALRSTSAQTAQTPAIPANVSGSGAAAASPVVTGEANGLYAMVLAALQQGQSTQYIDQMVNDAYRNQQVAVPAVLLTASGEVNTPALLTLFGGQ